MGLKKRTTTEQTSWEERGGKIAEAVLVWAVSGAMLLVAYLIHSLA